MKGGMMNRN